MSFDRPVHAPAGSRRGTDRARPARTGLPASAPWRLRAGRTRADDDGAGARGAAAGARGRGVARHTAAALWGGVVPASPDIQLVIPPGSRLRVSGIDARVRRPSRRRVAPRPSHDVAGADVPRPGRRPGSRRPGGPRRLPGPSRGVVDASTTSSPRAAAYRARHARPARRAAAYVRQGVDSPMESRLRMLLVLAGLPEPVVNHALPRRDDRPRALPARPAPTRSGGSPIEYDGRQHAENTRQWRWTSSAVRTWTRTAGGLVVVPSGDLYRSPARYPRADRGPPRERQGVSPRLAGRVAALLPSARLGR